MANNTNLGIKLTLLIVLKMKTYGKNIYVLQWNYKHDFKA